MRFRFGEKLLKWKFCATCCFFAYACQCVVTVPDACGKLVNVCNAHLIISILYLFPVIAKRKNIISLSLFFNLPGSHFFWHCPVLTMYHSLSETRHPLQPEEQEVGIDPLSSYSNKTGGEFCMQIHSVVPGNPSRETLVSSACLLYVILYMKLSRAS